MEGLEYPSIPRIPNPVREMKKQLDEALSLPTIDKYVAVTSKCGLGKKQGTKGTARGMEFDSYWEFAWYIYQVDIKGNVVTRNTIDSFEYTNELNEKARFFPDFKMQGCFHEIKGVYRANDLLKRDATLGLVTFWGPEEMKPIIKEVYQFDPNWKVEYMEMQHKTKYGKKSLY